MALAAIPEVVGSISTQDKCMYDEQDGVIDMYWEIYKYVYQLSSNHNTNFV